MQPPPVQGVNGSLPGGILGTNVGAELDAATSVQGATGSLPGGILGRNVGAGLDTATPCDAKWMGGSISGQRHPSALHEQNHVCGTRAAATQHPSTWRRQNTPACSAHHTMKLHWHAHSSRQHTGKGAHTQHERQAPARYPLCPCTHASRPHQLCPQPCAPPALPLLRHQPHIHRARPALMQPSCCSRRCLASPLPLLLLLLPSLLQLLLLLLAAL
jgi:hypothetical protein